MAQVPWLAGWRRAVLIYRLGLSTLAGRLTGGQEDGEEEGAEEDQEAGRERWPTRMGAVVIEREDGGKR